MEQPLLGMHYAANLERARSHYRQERRTINQQGPAHTQVVVTAGRACTLAQLYQHLGHPVELLGSHFPQWGRELWQPIQTAVIKAQLRGIGRPRATEHSETLIILAAITGTSH